MKLLLINSNPIVSKLIKLSADKVNIDVLESETLEGIDLNDIGLVFVDDKSLRKDLAETLAQKLPNAKLGFIYSKNSKKENGFTLYVQKPFLPTDFVELLKNETIGMDKKAFASPEAGAATTAVAQEEISVEDVTAIPDDMLQQSLGKSDNSDVEEGDDLIQGDAPEEGIEPVESEENDNFDPDSLPEAPEGSTEGLEGIEGLDSDVGSLLGGDDEDEKLPFEGEEEIDLEDDSLDGLDRPKPTKAEEPEPEPSAADGVESDELDLGEGLDLGGDSEVGAPESKEPESDDLDLDKLGIDTETKAPAEKESVLDEDDIAEVKSLLEDDAPELDIDVSAEGDDLDLDLDLDLADESDVAKTPEPETESAESEDAAAPQSDDLDLDLGDDLDLGEDLDLSEDIAPEAESDSAAEESAAPENAALDEDFELDLGELGEDEATTESAESEDAAAPQSDDLDLDLGDDLDLGEDLDLSEDIAPEAESDSAAEESAAPENAALDEDFELDLGELGEDEATTESAESEDAAAPQSDDLDLDLGDDLDLNLEGDSDVPDDIDLGDLLDEDDGAADIESAEQDEVEETSALEEASEVEEVDDDDFEETIEENIESEPAASAKDESGLDESDREIQSLNEVEVGAALGEEIEPPEEPEIAIDEPLDVVIPPIESVAAAATEAAAQAATHEIEPAPAPKKAEASVDNSAALANALQALPIPALKQLLNGMQLTITIRFPEKDNEK